MLAGAATRRPGMPGPRLGRRATGRVVRAQLHRGRLDDPAALVSARLLAARIDNPALTPLLDGARAGV